jgi:hypothetical protein
MRRKIGIGLLILLNLTFTWIISLRAVLAFGLIVLPLEREIALEITKSTTQEVLIEITVFSGIVFLINFLLFKKLVLNKKPFLTSLILTLIGIVVIISFFISARQSFLDFQNLDNNKVMDITLNK